MSICMRSEIQHNLPLEYPIAIRNQQCKLQSVIYKRNTKSMLIDGSAMLRPGEMVAKVNDIVSYNSKR